MAFLPIDYQATPVNPSVGGLYQAAQLIDVPAPSRLASGVNIRPFNCSPAYGTWDTDPCAEPVGKKAGLRADPADTFDPVLVWGYDQCDPMETTEDVRARAMQNLRLNEQEFAEEKLAERLILDATEAGGSGVWIGDDLVETIGLLERELGNRAGYIHANPFFASALANLNLINRVSGSPFLRSPLGHVYVFGGGYADGIGSTFVATSQPIVWRDEAVVNDALDPYENLRVAVAERHIVSGYECVYAAARYIKPVPGEDSPASFFPGGAVPGDVVPG